MFCSVVVVVVVVGTGGRRKFVVPILYCEENGDVCFYYLHSAGVGQERGDRVRVCVCACVRGSVGWGAVFCGEETLDLTVFVWGGGGDR